MSKRFRLIFTLLVAYVMVQFLWWEILLVRQNNAVIREKQKLVGLSSTDSAKMEKEILVLEHHRHMQTYMIVGEGTVFLLILLYGIYKVRQAMVKENELNNQQKNFILSVTHELKTPIAATKLQLQTLLKHELERDKQKQLLLNAVNETNRLNKLVEDVLLANQIENNNLSVHKEPINLSETTEQVLRNYFSAYLDNGRLCMQIEPGLTVSGDKILLPSVIINLTENAIKYSFGDIKVKVSLRREGEQVLLQVADNGSGVAVSEREKIFGKFYRSGNEDTRKTKGTGLGLYIVKKIVRAHDGRIAMEPNKPTGTVFSVYL